MNNLMRFALKVVCALFFLRTHIHRIACNCICAVTQHCSCSCSHLASVVFDGWCGFLSLSLYRVDSWYFLRFVRSSIQFLEHLRILSCFRSFKKCDAKKNEQHAVVDLHLLRVNREMCYFQVLNIKRCSHQLAYFVSIIGMWVWRDHFHTLPRCYQEIGSNVQFEMRWIFEYMFHKDSSRREQTKKKCQTNITCNARARNSQTKPV